MNGDGITSYQRQRGWHLADSYSNTCVANLKRKLTLTSLKKKAWDLLSKIIRMQAANRMGNCKCVTCGAWKPWHGAGMQAGHFIAGRGNSILFDERGIYPQCYHCNIGLKGNMVEYFVFMEWKHGRKVIDDLRELKHQTVKFTRHDHLMRIDEYKHRLQKLQGAA